MPEAPAFKIVPPPHYGVKSCLGDQHMKSEMHHYKKCMGAREDLFQERKIKKGEKKKLPDSREPENLYIKERRNIFFRKDIPNEK